MAFTHRRPEDHRHYLTAYSLNTDGTRTTNSYSVVESSSQYILSSATSATYQSVSETYDGTQKLRSSSQTQSTQKNYVTNNSDLATTVGETFISSSSSSGDLTSAVGSSLSFVDRGITVYADNSGLTSNTNRDETTGFTSTYGATNYNASGFGSYSLSQTVRFEGDETHTRTTSFSFSSSMTSIRFTSRDGSITSSSSSRSTASGGTTYTAGQPDTDPWQDQDGDQGDDIGLLATGTVTEVTEAISSSTKTSAQNINCNTTTTTNKSIYYTRRSTDFNTYFTFYEINTSTTDFSTIDRTIDTIEEGTITLTNSTISTHKIVSVLGGAYYITGGSSLPNGYGTGLGTATTISNPTIELSFQNYSYKPYLSDGSPQPTVTITDFNSTQNTDTDLLVTTISFNSSSEGTRIVESFKTLNEDANFGEDSGASIFTTQTFASFYQETYLNSAFSRSTTVNTIYNGRDSVLINASRKTTTLFTSSYNGSDGFGTYEYLKVTNTTTEHPRTFNVLSQTGTRVDANITQFTIDPIQDTQTYGWRPAQVRKDIFSYDKGEEGGVQYSTSSDISGAIRGFKNASITDARLTTTTSSNGITINSSSSGSYESGGFPLGFTPSLNRYVKYLPDNSYGSVYYNAFGGTGDSNQVDLSPIEDGVSDIKYHREITFSSTFDIATSNTSDTSADTITVANIKTAKTTLIGRIEIENATADDNYRRTVLKDNGFNTINAHGGYLFTDREGVIINDGVPTTIYAFGPSGSTSITQGSTEVGDGTNIASNTLPANSMVFLNESTIPSVLNFGILDETIDRKQ